MSTGQPGHSQAAPASKEKTRKGSYAHGLLKSLKEAVKAYKDNPTDDNKRIIDQLAQEIYSRYQDQFQQYILWLSNHKGYGLTTDDAQDILQLTFWKIVSRIETYRERGSKKHGKKGAGGRSWMITICRNTTIDWVKERNKQVPTAPPEEHVEEHRPEPVPEDIFLGDEDEKAEDQTEHEKHIRQLRKAKLLLSKADQAALDKEEGPEYDEAVERLCKIILANPDFLQ